MISRDGSLFHIDYGFMLSSAPGRGIKVETSIPFKLTAEFVKILGGPTSKIFKRYKSKMVSGLLRLKEESAKLLLLVRMVAMSNSDFSCFAGGNTDIAITELEQRLCARQELSQSEADAIITELIGKSENNWLTWSYDSYQLCCNNIY